MYWSADKKNNLKKGDLVIYIDKTPRFIDKNNYPADEGTITFEFGHICDVRKVDYSMDGIHGYKVHLYVPGMDNYLHYEDINSFMLLPDYREMQIDSILS